MKSYGDSLARNLKESLEQGAEHEPRLRLSGIGKPSRKLFYELTQAPKESLSGQVFFKFQYGHILEELFLTLAKEAGYDVTDEQLEVSFEGITGHIDAVINGVLVDVKSASPYGYVKFADGSIRDNDPFGYLPQLAAYYQSLGLKEGAAFVAIQKVSGEMCVCYLSHEEMMSIDVTSHAKRQKRVQALATSKAPKVPERCYDDKPDGKSGNRVLRTECSYCPFKFYCWRDANDGQGLRTFLYSNGPRFATEVKRIPKVFEAPTPEGVL